MVKTRYKEQNKQKPQVAISEPLNPNRVFVKVNGHPALALIDLQTIRADVIRVQFGYLYKLPLVSIQPKTIATPIRGSKGTVVKTREVELNCGRYEENRIFHVAHLSGCDIISGKPVVLNF